MRPTRSEGTGEMGASAAATGPRSRPLPVRNPEFAHLSLQGLRTYRKALGAEEGRVSYWRRLIQARLDLVRSYDAGQASVDSLRGMFTGSRTGNSRLALMSVLPVDDMPPLPDLATLWEREPVIGAEADNEDLARELALAESQLSAYRTSLHRRLAAATAELIARYREDPMQCLSVLPLRAPVQPRATGS